MAELHHLKRLFLSRYRQFVHCEIDLTDPETGTIRADLCLTGPNGSGKSTLLSELYQSMDPSDTGDSAVMQPDGGRDDLSDALVLAKYSSNGDDLYLARHAAGVEGEMLLLSAEIERSDPWESLAITPPGFEEFRSRFADYLLEEAIPSPAPESRRAWFGSGFSRLDGTEAGDFAAFLDGHLQARESHFHYFLKRPENRDKTVAELEREFESGGPVFLTALKEFWETLMEPGGLRFEFSQPAPVLLPDGTCVPFAALSPSIQTLLFRFGQIYSQFFGTDPRPGSVFLDTPEEGLSPELRSTLIDHYRSILPKHQAPLVVATHCPLIAAQFPETSRLRLNYGTDGTVVLAQGSAVESVRSEIETETETGSDIETETGSDIESETESETESEIEAEVQPETETSPTQASDARHSRYTRLKRAIQDSENQGELADLIDEIMAMRKF